MIHPYLSVSYTFQCVVFDRLTHNLQSYEHAYSQPARIRNHTSSIQGQPRNLLLTKMSLYAHLSANKCDLLRSKGLTELGLAELGYKETIIFRPAALTHAERSERRLMESVAMYVALIIVPISVSLYLCFQLVIEYSQELGPKVFRSSNYFHHGYSLHGVLMLAIQCPTLATALKNAGALNGATLQQYATKDADVPFTLVDNGAIRPLADVTL